MSSFVEIKDAIEKIAEAHEEFKRTNDARLEAAKKGDEARSKELDAKLGRLNEDIGGLVKVRQVLEQEIQLQRERIEELESRGKNPGRTAKQKDADEYKAHFLNWVRNRGQSPQDELKMLELQKKDVTTTTGAAGGFGVPEEIARSIEKHELKFSPVRSLVKVVTVGTSDYKELLAINGATAGWVGETGTRSATNTPTLREITPTQGELYAYPQVSEWALDDIFFSIEDWLGETVGEQFALSEGDAVIRGNGTTKPTGMLNSAPTAVSDETATRAAAVYEFQANVSATLLILPDAVIDLQHKLNSAYAADAVWVMNTTTAGAVRKIKDTTNQYLWQPSLIAGTPDQLLNKPVVIWEQMDSIANNNHPIAYGNFRRGYVLVDRVGMRMTRDNVTNVGFVRYYIRRREGGIVLNNNAIKFLKTTTA